MQKQYVHLQNCKSIRITICPIRQQGPCSIKAFTAFKKKKQPCKGKAENYHFLYIINAIYIDHLIIFQRSKFLMWKQTDRDSEVANFFHLRKRGLGMICGFKARHSPRRHVQSFIYCKVRKDVRICSSY